LDFLDKQVEKYGARQKYNNYQSQEHFGSEFAEQHFLEALSTVVNCIVDRFFKLTEDAKETHRSDGLVLLAQACDARIAIPKNDSHFSSARAFVHRFLCCGNGGVIVGI
jgi:hypothetical protein